MAEAHKFSDLNKAVEVFPELTWAQDADGQVYVDNSKTGERATVSKGQYIVKIADRYEVHDEAPENAKKAEKPKADAKAKDAEFEAPNPQVEPNAVGAPADSEAGQAADPASQDASASE